MKTKINVYNKIFLILLTIISISGLGKITTNSPYNNGGNNNNSLSPNQVWMQNILYVPATKTITVGTTTNRVNENNVIHISASSTPGNPDGVFDSGYLSNGQIYSYTFNTKGTFNYYCRIHLSRMTGVIIVQ